MGRAAVQLLAMLLVGILAGTAAFQFWLGLDAAKAPFPGSSFGWLDVALGASGTLLWATFLLRSRMAWGYKAGLAGGAATLAGLTFWVGIDQLIVL